MSKAKLLILVLFIFFFSSCGIKGDPPNLYKDPAKNSIMKNG